MAGRAYPPPLRGSRPENRRPGNLLTPRQARTFPPGVSERLQDCWPNRAGCGFARERAESGAPPRAALPSRAPTLRGERRRGPPIGGGGLMRRCCAAVGDGGSSRLSTGRCWGERGSAEHPARSIPHSWLQPRRSIRSFAGDRA